MTRGALQTAAAGLAGLVFGIGLILSGMADPSKVLGFLDLAGAWDPSLAFVMAGAVAVAAIGFALARRRRISWLGQPIDVPASRRVDRRLVLGALVFGIGWGLAGFCPGPALVALGMGQGKAALFVAAMLAGMGIFELAEAWRRRAGDRHDAAWPAIDTAAPPSSDAGRPAPLQLAARKPDDRTARSIRQILQSSFPCGEAR